MALRKHHAKRLGSEHIRSSRSDASSGKDAKVPDVQARVSKRVGGRAGLPEVQINIGVALCLICHDALTAWHRKATYFWWSRRTFRLARQGEIFD